MNPKRFIKNIGLYFLGTFSTKILQFLFIPIYTKYIITSDYGYYNLVLSILSLSIPLLYQSIWEGVLRFVIIEKKDDKKILATTTTYLLGLSFIYIILYYFAATTFSIQYGNAILIMGLSQLGVSYWQFSARALKRNKIYSISTIVNSSVTIALNVLLIVAFKLGLLGLFVANTIGNLVMIAILERDLKLFKSIKEYKFDKQLLISIIKYSFPLCVNTLSWWLINSSNNLVITYRIGIEQNGIYAMASRFGSIMTLFTSIVTMAWLEESFITYADKNSDDYFNNVFNILSRLLLSGVALLIPITNIFYKYLVYGDYQQGIVLVPIIYLSAAYSTFSSHIGSGFLARKESDIIFKTSIFGGIVSVVGGYILAKPFGITGVVITSLFGYMLMFGLRIPLLRKRMNLKIDFSALISMTVFSFIIMLISNLYVDSLIYQLIIIMIVGVSITYFNRKIIKIFIELIQRKVLKK